MQGTNLALEKSIYIDSDSEIPRRIFNKSFLNNAKKLVFLKQMECFICDKSRDYSEKMLVSIYHLVLLW